MWGKLLLTVAVSIAVADFGSKPSFEHSSSVQGNPLQPEHSRFAAKILAQPHPKANMAAAAWKKMFGKGKEPIFGGSLMNAVARSHWGNLPDVVVDCVQYILASKQGHQDFLEAELNDAATERVAEIVQGYEANQYSERGPYTDVNFAHVPEAVAVLKKFLSELKPAFLPYPDTYYVAAIFEDMPDGEEQNPVEGMKALLYGIVGVEPMFGQLEVDLLSYLMHFLHSTVKGGDVNKAAAIFSNALFHRMGEQDLVQRATKLLIEECESIFPKKANPIKAKE